MADAAVLEGDEIVLHDARALGLHRLPIQQDRGLVLLREVHVRNVRVDLAPVDQDNVHPARPQVLVEHAQMVADPVTVRLPRLGDQVADIEDRRAASPDGLDHLGRDQVREDAGIEAAGAEDDEVAVEDAGHDLRG